MDSQSRTETMTGVLGQGNYAHTNGGCIGVYASSQVQVEDSGFEGNV